MTLLRDVALWVAMILAGCTLLVIRVLYMKEAKRGYGRHARLGAIVLALPTVLVLVVLILLAAEWWSL
jgi:hypothetical protein